MKCLHYCGKPESAALQKTDDSSFCTFTRRRKGKLRIAAFHHRPDFENFITFNWKMRQGFIDDISGKAPAAHLDTKTSPVESAGGTRRFRKPPGIPAIIQPPFFLQAKNHGFEILSGNIPLRKFSPQPGNGIIPSGQQPQRMLIGLIRR